MSQIVWNINTPDGHYVGQYAASAPEVAFNQYLTVSGRPNMEPGKNLPVQAENDGSHRITFEDNEFILKPQ